MNTLYFLSIMLSVLLLFSAVYLAFKKILVAGGLQESLRSLKSCVVNPSGIDSHVGIFFGIIFLILPIFWGLALFLKTDGNVLVVIFTIGWIYNWIKYTYLSDKQRLDLILSKDHPFYQKFLKENPTLDSTNLLKTLMKEYNLSTSSLNRIFTENPYWQKLFGNEFFEQKELSPEVLKQLNDDISSISSRDVVDNFKSNTKETTTSSSIDAEKTIPPLENYSNKKNKNKNKRK